MTTEDCKAFLAEHAALLGEPPNQVWKRASKRKEGGAVLREFVSSEGRSVTLAEVGGALSVAEAGLRIPEAHEAEPAFGVLRVGKSPSAERVVAFLIDCLREVPDEVEEDARERAMDPRSWRAPVVFDRSDSDGLDGAHELSPNWNDGPEDIVPLPYEGQPEDVAWRDVERVYELIMPDYDTAYRFAVYLTRDGRLLMGSNNPD